MKNKCFFIVITLLYAECLFAGIKTDTKSIVSQRAYYRVIDSELQGKPKSYTLTVWMTGNMLALEKAGNSSIALWHNWQTSKPTLFQVFKEHDYRIEFERIHTQKHQRLLAQLQALLQDGSFVQRATINNKQLILQRLIKDDMVELQINRWSDYKTYDYADIGDNEADPVLAKLIHQGFIQKI
ncbi:MAG: hypothetical protein HWD86_02640 [Kangiellaceae bacterium]|nr:hypothetical protein [Kangiellaceae bacterium]